MPDMPLTGLPSSNPLPGDFVEVRFAQGVSLGDLGTKKVLLIGHKISGGTATADTEIVGPIQDEQQAIDAFGAGSIAHLMVYQFLQEAGGALAGLCELYAIAAAEPSGTNASGTVAFATNPTAAGVATVTIAGVTYSYGYTASDTPTTIGDALAALVNADPRSPVTASNSTGTITFTFRTDGPEGNGIRIRGSVTPGTAVTATPTASTALSSGATATSYTNVLATILPQRFDYIVPHCVDATALDAIKTQVANQALPGTGMRQQVIAAVQDTASNANTLASGRNFARMSIANLEGHEAGNYVLAAAYAAARVLSEVPDPSFNFDGYQLRSIKAPHTSSLWFTSSELVSMLNNGVTPIGVTATGQTYIARAITTYCLNGANADYRARDTIRVTVADRMAADWIARVSTAGYSKITSDPVPNGQQPPAAFITPKRGKAIVEQLISDYVDNGWLDPGSKAEMLASVTVGINSSNAAAMDFQIPIKAAQLFHQSRTRIDETSRAN